MTASETPVHAFEKAGLGKAPFRLLIEALSIPEEPFTEKLS